MNRILSLVGVFLILPVAIWLAQISKSAPKCCGLIMDYKGSQHSLLRGETFTYQCTNCKSIELLSNHRDINIIMLIKDAWDEAHTDK